MLSLCVEDYFLKGLEISWWRMCRASAWSRYLPWWVLECRETGNHSPTCSRGWAAASVTPANTRPHHRVNSGHERSAAASLVQVATLQSGQPPVLPVRGAGAE